MIDARRLATLIFFASIASAVDSVRVSEVTVPQAHGQPISAYLVEPPGGGKAPCAIFVHWYESESPTSNKTQFLAEAVELGRHGLLSLLVETPWSRPEWFPERDVKRDLEMSNEIVDNLRSSLDYLLKLPRASKDRVALVGHDFGAMYGAVLGSGDPRIKVFALQAGTARFSDWFLYNQQSLSDEGKRAVVAKLEPLAPVTHIAKLAPRPVLLQFGTKDPHVPKERADQIATAAGEPKKVLRYDTGHELNAKASADRQAWLREVLHLDGR